MIISDNSVLTFKIIRFLLIGYNINEFDIKQLMFNNGTAITSIKSFTTEGDYITVTLNNSIDIKEEFFVIYKQNIIKLNYSELYKSKEFNDKYYFSGELGAFYGKDSTTFKLWSPAAKSVKVLIFKNGDAAIQETPSILNMEENNGLWSVKVLNNLKGYFYTYKIEVYNIVNEAVDPYAKFVGVNGLRGAIEDLEESSPEGWTEDSSPLLKNYTDAIIYEISVRDMTTHPDSAVNYKGKFLGLTEDDTKSSKDLYSGISHIKELGVTHVQLMPVFDFSYISTDEKDPVKYNWGYDPQNYNVPEGSYSTNPYNPLCRVLEFKEMIKHIHSLGVGVIMDVVYNHMFNPLENNLEKVFPGYYFRLDVKCNFSNGTGCGSDTASEHPMMRKFILDSVLYFANTYHIDGFRFDLMGVHDFETMNIIRYELDKLPRKILVYGEGWDLNTSLPHELKAVQSNAWKMPHIGFFNDTIRDTIRGSVFNNKDSGFISGKSDQEHTIKKCVTGLIKYSNELSGIYDTPDQSINYICAHDNNTLWDKLELSNSYDSYDDRKSMHMLGNAIVLTCQGISFLHGGVDFCRTKKGIENSYNHPDHINWMDWDRKSEFYDVFQYFKGLINLRREHPAFRMDNSQEIRDHLVFLDNMPQNTVGFILKDNANGDIWRNIIVVYNANKYPVIVNIPYSDYSRITDLSKGYTQVIATDKIECAKLSMTVLYN